MPAPRSLAFAALIGLLACSFAAPVGAQPPGTEPEAAPRPPSYEDLHTLVRAGLRTEEIEEVFTRRGVPALKPEQIEELAKLGLAASLKERLLAARRQADAILTVEDVVEMVREKTPTPQIVLAIRNSKSAFELDIDGILELVRQGVPAPVLQAMREKSRPPEPEPAVAMTLDEVRTMARAQWSAERILERIRAARARFEITTDDLISLGRDGVPPPVLKHLWDTRIVKEVRLDDPARPVSDTGESPEEPEGGPEKTDHNGESDAQYLVHTEPSGAFSILVPTDWALHRESRGQNALLGFTTEPLDSPGAITDAELHIFRTRARHPERLTGNNLRPIAENFLGRLLVTSKQQGRDLSYRLVQDTKLSGASAVEYAVSSSDEKGRTREGRVLVCFARQTVYMISVMHDSELRGRWWPVLENCLRSFTVERDYVLPKPAVTRDQTLSLLFDQWRTALVNRDWARYRLLLPLGKDDLEHRLAFLQLCDRLERTRADLLLVSIGAGSDEAAMKIEFSAGGVADTRTLHWVGDGQSYRLLP